MEINQVGSFRSDINEMLSKIREVSGKTKMFGEHDGIKPAHELSGFDGVMNATKGVVSNVNQQIVERDRLQDAYISGDSNVSMSQVILATQKSKMAFEGLISVRNKILDAYKEIMNMPV